MLHLWLHRGQNRELDRSNNPKRCGSQALFKRYKSDSKHKGHKHVDTNDTDKDSERTQRLVINGTGVHAIGGCGVDMICTRINTSIV